MNDLHERYAEAKERQEKGADPKKNLLGRLTFMIGHHDDMELLDDAMARIAELEARDKRLMTKQGNFKGTGDPELDVFLKAAAPDRDWET